MIFVEDDKFTDTRHVTVSCRSLSFDTSNINLDNPHDFTYIFRR